VVEAALRAPDRTPHPRGRQPVRAGRRAHLHTAFGTRDGARILVNQWFQDMFTADSAPAVAAAIIERSRHLSQAIIERLLVAMLRYDLDRLTAALGELRVPVMAIQTPYSNERRERRSLLGGQETPYLEMLGQQIPTIRIEVILDSRHFPQIDRSAQTNALIDSFLAGV
jgi:pimeloyl-ACP methyl ester carboxylesterase